MFDLCMQIPLADALWRGFWISSAIGKIVVYCQLFLSIVAVARGVGRQKYFKKIEKTDKRFLSELNGCANDVLQYFIMRKSNRKNTAKSIELMYHKTCERMLRILNPETRRDLIGRTTSSNSAIALTSKEIDLLRNTCEQVASVQEQDLEKSMSWIATVVTTAPMLGLLGTVWGVLEAFDGMGGSDTVQLSAIAPAISSAMVTTVIGLLIAIPLSMWYNHLSTKLRELLSSMDNFTDELIARIAIEYQGGGE